MKKEEEEERELMMKCLYCKGEVESKQDRIIPKKFCSRTCSMKYFSKQRYLRIKNTKEFKQERKKYFKKWLEKNREHFNDIVRPKARDYQNKKYHYRINNGLCIHCGGKIEKERLPHRECFKCNKMIKEEYAKKHGSIRK